MEKRHVTDKRSVRLEKILSKDYIPLGEGRPDRSKIIGSDDIINLRIALHTAGSIEDFVNSV